MSNHIVIAFCAHADRGRIIEALTDSIEVYFDDDTIDISCECVVLLAVGGDSAAPLVRWIGRHGLDSVTGIGFVGVTAPWAEPYRTEPPVLDRMVAALEASRVYGGARVAHVPLGPLDPLRVLAERARRGQMCAHESCILSGQDCGERVYPFRFVVACAPDDGVCVFCEGTGAHKGWLRPAPDCSACAGTGKALSSADVARELSGDTCTRTDVWQVAHGGVTIRHYPTRVALIDLGLRAVVDRFTR